MPRSEAEFQLVADEWPLPSERRPRRKQPATATATLGSRAADGNHPVSWGKMTGTHGESPRRSTIAPAKQKKPELHVRAEAAAFTILPIYTYCRPSCIRTLKPSSPIRTMPKSQSTDNVNLDETTSAPVTRGYKARLAEGLNGDGAKKNKSRVSSEGRSTMTEAETAIAARKNFEEWASIKSRDNSKKNNNPNVPYDPSEESNARRYKKPRSEKFDIADSGELTKERAKNHTTKGTSEGTSMKSTAATVATAVAANICKQDTKHSADTAQTRKMRTWCRTATNYLESIFTSTSHGMLSPDYEISFEADAMEAEAVETETVQAEPLRAEQPSRNEAAEVPVVKRDHEVLGAESQQSTDGHARKSSRKRTHNQAYKQPENQESIRQQSARESKDLPACETAPDEATRTTREFNAPKPKKDPYLVTFDIADFAAPNVEFSFKISSWNVAGLRPWLRKGGLKFIEYEDPDILCLQETNCPNSELPEYHMRIPGYYSYWLCMQNGCAGVAIYTKRKPKKVMYGIGVPEFDDVARIIIAEYKPFFMINVNVPNSGRNLIHLDMRMAWDRQFQFYVRRLDAIKPVIICGNMNVAHLDIDLANPMANKRSPGFTNEERDAISELLNRGFIDTFRYFYPDRTQVYTFWAYMAKSRARNLGWRWDYCFVSERIINSVVDNVMRTQCLGSNHCPITIFFDFSRSSKSHA